MCVNVCDRFSSLLSTMKDVTVMDEMNIRESVCLAGRLFSTCTTVSIVLAMTRDGHGFPLSLEICEIVYVCGLGGCSVRHLAQRYRTKAMRLRPNSAPRSSRVAAALLQSSTRHSWCCLDFLLML